MSIQILAQPAIAQNVVILTLEVVSPRAEELVSFLKKGDLPNDKKAAIKLKAKAAQVTLVNGLLYKKGFHVTTTQVCVTR